MRFRLDIHWRLQSEDLLLEIPDKLLKLLGLISDGQNLRQAAKSLGVSYRTAWGMIAEWEKTFGNPLVISERGRGTTLTAFASSLLQTRAEIDTQFRDPLDAAAEAASGHLTRMSIAETTALRIVSSDHAAINQLANKLRDAPERRVVLDIIGSESALRRYQRPDADVVGFHIPVGQNFTLLANRLVNLLNQDRDEIYELEQRELGLIFTPKLNIQTLADLVVDPKPRFINRQPGSTTRLAFDTLLEHDGIGSAAIDGYSDEEHTHTAVAARIASGERDVGFAERRVAEKFSLGFAPLVAENFYICWKSELQHEIKSEIIRSLGEDPALNFTEISLGAVRKIHGIAN